VQQASRIDWSFFEDEFATQYSQSRQAIKTDLLDGRTFHSQASGRPDDVLIQDWLQNFFTRPLSESLNFNGALALNRLLVT
jgi:hypothetical protein